MAIISGMTGQAKSNDWRFDSTDETDQTAKDVRTCPVKK